ncbi:MAG TPA: hypothetical protein VG273_06195 [Bryobacteraceae bacterium]|nr:hypothetical protein [Bryobacteraceae bacterium]
MRFITLLVFLPLLSAQDRPIPGPATLIKQVTAHQREMEVVRENYTCHQITETQVLDGKGEVKSTASEEHEVFFVNHHRVARLVKKNDIGLTPAEEKSEQSRVLKQVERFMKGPPGRNRQALRISEILAVSTISDPRRLSLNNRDTLAFDFIGDPDAEARGVNQNAGKKLAGTLWIDEADLQVARIEINFYENFSIGGGVLASIQKGTKMTMEQSPVGDGLWMPSLTDQHLAARVLMFDSIRRDLHQKEFDFHKFDVASIQQIQPPADPLP